MDLGQQIIILRLRIEFYQAKLTRFLSNFQAFILTGTSLCLSWHVCLVEAQNCKILTPGLELGYPRVLK